MKVPEDQIRQQLGSETLELRSTREIQEQYQRLEVFSVGKVLANNSSLPPLVPHQERAHQLRKGKPG